MTSNRELARQLGVSETAVRRAEKAGRIKREADRAWDPARVKAAWAGNTDQAQQRGKPSAGNGSRNAARRAVKPVPEAALGAVRETLREHGEPPLPAPDRRPADPRAPGDLGDLQPLYRAEDDPSPRHVLLSAVAIDHHRLQTSTIRGRDPRADDLSRAPASHTRRPL